MRWVEAAMVSAQEPEAEEEAAAEVNGHARERTVARTSGRTGSCSEVA